MSEESTRTLVMGEAMRGRITRRGLLRRAAVLGLSIPAISAVLAACGDDESTPTTSTTTGGATTTATTPATSGGAAATPGGATPGSSPAPAGGTPASSPSGSVGAANWKPRTVTARLTGSGASFPDPIYQLWIQHHSKVLPEVKINYQSVGSGQGIRDFTGGVSDFGASDAPMTDQQMASAPDALHIPTVLGAVVATYNVPNVTNLQFSGETLARIFLGEIKTWNDRAIAADNSGVQLPNLPITVVYRSDGSGTTSIFTDYLSKISPTWKSQVGAGTAVQWPTGIGAEKNPGVAAGVQQTPGAIGYVELVYALANKLPVPAIKNAAGSFVQPSLESTSAAAAGFLSQLPDDLRVSITNPPQGAQAYPISGFTWLLVHGNMSDMNKAQALTDFIYWALTQGDQWAKEVHYAPLPVEVKQKAIAKLEKVMVNGQAAFKIPA